MNEKLLKNPSQPFQFDDDDQCKQLLVELGIANRFSLDPVKNQKSTTQTLTELNHQTHWILAMLFLGKDKATDNGYLILCLPKNSLTVEGFLAVCGRMTRGQGRVEVAKVIPPGATDN